MGYGGNFGIAQGLGIVLDAAEELRGEDVRFVLVGAGPLSDDIREQRDRRRLDSVELRPGVPVTEVGAFLLSCDAVLVPLRDHPIFEDFIPSKLYDAMAVGRPALVAARGEAAALVREHACGLEVAPESGPELAGAVRTLMGDRERSERLGAAGKRAAASYARSRQVDRLQEGPPRGLTSGRLYEVVTSSVKDRPSARSTIRCRPSRVACAPGRRRAQPKGTRGSAASTRSMTSVAVACPM